MNNKILIIGYGSESTIRFFIKYLESIHASYKLFDLDKCMDSSQIDVFFEGSQLDISLNDDNTSFQDFQAFYCRYYYIDTSVVERNEVFSKCLQCINSWLLTTEKVVINRPGCGSSNSSKLAHILDLQECGFRIPLTYIIGDGKVAMELLADGKEWISKGCSSYRTRAELLSAIGYSKFALLAYTPSQFQEFIHGVDIRLHVLGRTVIGLRITSPNVDYRYNTSNNHYEAFQPPDDIINACFAYCAKEHLAFAGFDFKINSKGEYYILEANPMPGYEFFDKRLDGKISSALYDMLMHWEKPVSTTIVTANQPFIVAERRKKFH